MRYPGDQRTANQIITEEKQGRIRSVFPAEWMDSLPDEIYTAAKNRDKTARTAKKLLDSREYDKESKN